MTLQQLRAERESHLAYLSGMLDGKVARPLANLGELRATCRATRAALEAQRERLREQRTQLEAQMANVEQQLQVIRGVV